MRKFKFRVWDKEEKRFWYFDLQEVLERQMAYKGSWDLKILKGEKTEYTGLKDKNGKEIYEGDIVKFTERHYENCKKKRLTSEETSIQIVVYDYYSFGLRGSLKDKDLRPFIWALSFDYKIEVIGNIYEDCPSRFEVE